MNLIKEKHIYILSAVLLCILTSINAYAEPLMPDGITIQDKYKSSSQAVAGIVREVSGQVVIIHSDNNKIGYKTAAGFDIYEKDTIISQPDGRIRIELKDGSTVNIASATKLIFSESIYRPEEKVRSSFLNLLIGKAHFLVKKLSGYNKSKFEVRTKTAVVGVRGTEFIVESALMTKVITLEADLWVENLLGQGIKLDSYMKTIITKGASPTIPESVLPDEIELMLEESFLTMPKLHEALSTPSKEEKNESEKIKKTNSADKLKQSEGNNTETEESETEESGTEESETEESETEESETEESETEESETEESETEESGTEESETEESGTEMETEESGTEMETEESGTEMETEEPETEMETEEPETEMETEEPETEMETEEPETEMETEEPETEMETEEPETEMEIEEPETEMETEE
ncbi:FecR family protein, partial [Desulfobacterales bacterium HSG17]|nr:FecR family protein [Desulfobacterales bacterium HSG17]